MAHMIETAVPGMTREAAEGMIQRLEPLFKQAPGFLWHASGPSDGGWRVVEVWDTEEDWARWFEGTIKPMLPPDMNVGASHYDVEVVIGR